LTRRRQHEVGNLVPRSGVYLSSFHGRHTFGFLAFKPPTAEGTAVLDAMNSVHFSVGGQRISSYGGFYRGFGLSLSAAQLFSAFLAWQLGSLAKKQKTPSRLAGATSSGKSPASC
jgi:hypothetical protein